MLSGIGQGRSFPCASSATGLPAMVGSSTIDTTGNFCWAVVVAVSSRAKAMRTAGVSRFMGKDVRRCLKSARPRYGMMMPETTCRTRREKSVSHEGTKYHEGIHFRKHPWGVSVLLLRLFLGTLVGFLQIFAAFFEGAEGVVVGLDGLAVFVDRPLAPAGDIENLAQLDVAPDLGPARLAIAVQRGAVGIGRGLVVALGKENLGDAVVGQRTVFVEIESFIELGKRGGEVSLLLQSLSAENRSVELHIG